MLLISSARYSIGSPRPRDVHSILYSASVQDIMSIRYEISTCLHLFESHAGRLTHATVFASASRYVEVFHVPRNVSRPSRIDETRRLLQNSKNSRHPREIISLTRVPHQRIIAFARLFAGDWSRRAKFALESRRDSRAGTAPRRALVSASS